MLLRFDPDQKKLVACETLPDAGWIHLLAKTPQEVAALGDAIPPEFVRHALDVDEVARVDRAGEAILFIVRCPQHVPTDRDQPFRAVAVGIIVQGARVFTISASSPCIAEDFAATDDAAHTTDPMQFFLGFVIFVGERFLAQVRAIDDVVDQLENRLRRSLANREVFELLRHQKGLVHFRTALASNRLMLDRLSEDERFELSKKEKERLADARVETEQALAMAGVSADILGQLTDAFASIISNNLNVVMKVLTSLTIVMALPGAVGAIYGMNVKLPGQDSPYAFVAIVGATAAVAVALAAYFRHKRWL